MTGLLILVVSGLILLVGGTVYSRFLSRSFGEEQGRPTPAMLKNDGRDYVPTPTPVVFGHHFASIAGAGPIVGPVLAMCYGWGPAILWVILGSLFIGAVHDYLAAFMSMREGGQSVATIARRMLGRGPFVALMLFLVLMLGLVCATFLNLSATALTSQMPLERMDLPADQTLFRVVEQGGVRHVIIGGIASMSVIVITATGPLLGWMYIKRRVAVWKCSLVAIGICTVSILTGLYYPVALTPDVWKLLLAGYVLVAAGVPVWIFLQSRDFINVHILYIGMAALLVTLAVASVRGGLDGGDALPVVDLGTGAAAMGMLWPALFITIACGAVSGFHSLCAGGTTSKQLNSERAARRIGYWAMLLEAFLAACVIAVMVMGIARGDYLREVYPKVLDLTGRASNPILGFALAVGMAGKAAFGAPVAVGALAGMILLEGFLVTTLDTAVRLMRYLLEEIWAELFRRYDVFADKAAPQPADAVVPPAGSGGIPLAVASPAKADLARPLRTSGAFRILLRLLRHYWINSGLAVGVTLVFAFSAGILKLWGMFATSNQLLAALVLGLGSIWLLRCERKVWYVVGPAIFMLITTAASLVQLAVVNLPRRGGGNPVLFVADVMLMALTAYLVVAGVREAVSLFRRAPVMATAG